MKTGILRTVSFDKSRAKPKLCKVCKANPIMRPGAKVCGTECAEALAVSTRLKNERIAAKKQSAADRAQLQTLLTIPELKAKAQTAFNAYIRARDSDLPCICCGKWNKNKALRGGAFDAGHYKSRGSADHLRYDERNVHKQLKKCNRYADGNIVNYRIGLIARIGIEQVEALESDQRSVKWTREMLLSIVATYKQKLKDLPAAKHSCEVTA